MAQRRFYYVIFRFLVFCYFIFNEAGVQGYSREMFTLHFAETASFIVITRVDLFSKNCVAIISKSHCTYGPSTLVYRELSSLENRDPD